MPLVRIHKIKAVFVQIPKTGGTSIRDGLFPGGFDGPVEGWQPIPESWPTERSFAIVRHPFDRFVSACAFLGITHGEAIRILLDESIPGSPNARRPAELAKYHLLPQTDEVNRLHIATHIGRFENLQADFDAIALELSFPPAELPHHNASEHGRWEDALLEGHRAELAHLYGRDFSVLGYSPEPEPQPAPYHG